MIINLKTTNEGVWFPFFYSRIDPTTMDVIYDAPIEDGPKMKIRNPTAFFKERMQNRKMKSEYILNKKTRAMEKVSAEVDLSPAEKKAENDDFADYVIQGVDGFKLDGREIKCVRSEKIAIMDIPIISMYINRCIEMLRESSAEEEKAVVKN